MRNQPKPGQYVVSHGGAYVTRLLRPYGSGWMVEVDRPFEEVPGEGVVVYHHSTISSELRWTTNPAENIEVI